MYGRLPAFGSLTACISSPAAPESGKRRGRRPVIRATNGPAVEVPEHRGRSLHDRIVQVVGRALAVAHQSGRSLDRLVEVQHPIANRPLQLTESLVDASAEDLLRDREHVVEDLDAWRRPAKDIRGASDGASNRACHAAEVEPISIRATKVEPREGVEPTTYCLQNSCSAIELPRHAALRV